MNFIEILMKTFDRSIIIGLSLGVPAVSRPLRKHCGSPSGVGHRNDRSESNEDRAPPGADHQRSRQGDKVVISDAFGESIDGVPATTGTHFRNRAVAFARLGTLGN